mmetsp:Transcript_19331/g.33168  ORF Transcript_19331/g.33168 Transcript_19331/m.33168 type:complete len:93 (-) Transcript_19331:37-315(-)
MLFLSFSGDEEKDLEPGTWGLVMNNDDDGEESARKCRFVRISGAATARPLSIPSEKMDAFSRTPPNFETRRNNNRDPLPTDVVAIVMKLEMK